ncbi:MAG: hypothetical protein AB1512_06540 [Thermodesulfobacteriota bacterium]
MAATFVTSVILLIAVAAIGFLISHRPPPQQQFFFDLLEKNMPKETEGRESGISDPGSTSVNIGINPGKG